MDTEKEKKPNFLAVMIVATVLLATAALTITTIDNAFAYSKNQATTGTNACGNEESPTNIGCQNIDSQIQGDENSVALAGVQTFPSVIREPPVATCEGCFDDLNPEQLNAFLITMAERFDLGTLEEICDAVEALDPDTGSQQLALREITEILQGVPAPNVIDPATITEIIDCLEGVLGLA